MTTRRVFVASLLFAVIFVSAVYIYTRFDANRFRRDLDNSRISESVNTTVAPVQNVAPLMPTKSIVHEEHDEERAPDLDSQITVEPEYDDEEVESLKSQYAEVSARADEIISVLEAARAENVDTSIPQETIDDLNLDVELLNELAKTMFTPEELNGGD